MKNLKQIAEDSSYSFGMISGQKGERFLAYARNDKKEGRICAPLSYIKQSSDYSTMSFCV